MELLGEQSVVAVVHALVVVDAVAVGQSGEGQLEARLLRLQEFVDESVVGRVGRQRSQQVV